MGNTQAQAGAQPNSATAEQQPAPRSSSKTPSLSKGRSFIKFGKRKQLLVEHDGHVLVGGRVGLEDDGIKPHDLVAAATADTEEDGFSNILLDASAQLDRTNNSRREQNGSASEIAEKSADTNDRDEEKEFDYIQQQGTYRLFVLNGACGWFTYVPHLMNCCKWDCVTFHSLPILELILLELVTKYGSLYAFDFRSKCIRHTFYFVGNV